MIILRYGLILPQKKGLSKTTTLPKPSVFDDDSDEEVGKQICYKQDITICTLSLNKMNDSSILSIKKLKINNKEVYPLTSLLVSRLLSKYTEFIFVCFFPQTSVGESLQRESIKKKMMKQVRRKIKRFIVIKKNKQTNKQ